MKKTALITGASGEIGQAICKVFAENGYDLIMHYGSNFQPCEKLKTELETQYGIKVVCIQADFCDETQVENLAKTALESFDKIDVLVNNAGISLVRLFQLVTPQEARKVMSINLENTILLTQKIVPQMISNHSGKIVNIASMWAVSGASMEVHYSAAKAGLIGFTKALAKEVGLSGINVNCVCPGLIDTKMNSHLSKEDLQSFADDTPLGKVGTTKNVADLVEFLSSEKSEFITGQVISVDGGYCI